MNGQDFDLLGLLGLPPPHWLQPLAVVSSSSSLIRRRVREQVVGLRLDDQHSAGAISEADAACFDRIERGRNGEDADVSFWPRNETYWPHNSPTATTHGKMNGTFGH